MSRLIFLLLTGLLVSGCGSSDGSGDSTSSPGTTPPVLQPIPPPVSTARTWRVQGHVGPGGTFTGTFTYEKDAAPIAENVRGNQNVLYPLTAWDMTATVPPIISSVTGLPIPGLEPVVFFKKTGFVDTSELCFNECIFDPNDFSRLVFHNGMQTLVLLFLLPAPRATLPTEAGDWGVVEPRGSYLESGNSWDATFQYRMVVTDAELTTD